MTQHSQNDLPDERDTRSAFPSHRGKVDFGAFVRECVEKNSIDFLARVIREACLRVQGNLETAVKFLLRPRRPGISLDHWLRPEPAKTDHFFAGVNRNAGEGQLRTRQEDFATFFQGLNAARVVIEVGTHSAWVQEVIRGCGHEVLVANPRLMEGSKRRKRKNDRIDANKLARLGRVDPESLYPIQHRGREVRQDLVMLRARDALVAARTEIINTTRGLVKSMGTRLPKCSAGASHTREKKPFP